MLHAYKSVPASSVVPSEENPRTHSQEQLEQLRRSIREFGFTNPLLIDEDNRLIAGHGRLQAAIAEGMVDLPAIVVAGLTDAQKRALVIADNQLAMNAGWDDELLKLNLEALQQEDFDLSLIGFTEEQIQEILATGTPEGLTDPDEAPEPPANPVSVLGDTWTLGKHRLRCGDATKAEDVTELLAGVEPHLMVTDPPYGVSYDPEWRAQAGLNQNRKKMGKVVNDDQADWGEVWTLFQGDVIYVWSAPGPLQCVTHDSLSISGFDPRQQIIWAKDRFALGRGHYHYQHEVCWYAVRKGQTGHWHGDRSQTSVWNIPAREGNGLGHSTQKPVECMKRPIENNSSRGQAVYDPFSGSGTTIIAGEMTGRSIYAMEISPAYVDVAIERWQNFTGKSAMLDDRTFAEVKTQRHGAESTPADREAASGGGGLRRRGSAPPPDRTASGPFHKNPPKALPKRAGSRKGQGQRTGGQELVPAGH